MSNIFNPLELIKTKVLFDESKGVGKEPDDIDKEYEDMLQLDPGDISIAKKREELVLKGESLAERAQENDDKDLTEEAEKLYKEAEKNLEIFNGIVQDAEKSKSVITQDKKEIDIAAIHRLIKEETGREIDIDKDYYEDNGWEDESKHVILNKREARELAKEEGGEIKAATAIAKKDAAELANEKKTIKEAVAKDVETAAREFFPENKGIREILNNRKNKQKIDAYIDRVAEQLQARHGKKISGITDDNEANKVKETAVEVFKQLYLNDLMEEGFKLALKSMNKVEIKAYNNLSKEQKAQFKADFIYEIKDKLDKQNKQFEESIINSDFKIDDEKAFRKALNEVELDKDIKVITKAIEGEKNGSKELSEILKNQLGRTILINTAKDALKSNSTIAKKYSKKEIDIMLDIVLGKLPNDELKKFNPNPTAAKQALNEMHDSDLQKVLQKIEAKLDIQRQLGDIGREFYPNVKIDEQKLRFLAQLADEIQSLEMQENNLDDVLKKVMYEIGVSGYKYNQALSKEALEEIIADVKAEEAETESSPDQRERGNIKRDEVKAALKQVGSSDIARNLYSYFAITEGQVRHKNRDAVTELARGIGIKTGETDKVKRLAKMLDDIHKLNDTKRIHTSLLEDEYVKGILRYAVKEDGRYREVNDVLTGLKPDGAIGGRKEYLQMVNEIMYIKDNWSSEELGEIKDFLDKKGVFYKSSVKAKIHGTGENRVDIDKFNKYKNEIALMFENPKLYHAIEASAYENQIHDTDKYMVTIADKLVELAEKNDKSLKSITSVEEIIKAIEITSLSSSAFGNKKIDKKLLDKNEAMFELILLNPDLYNSIMNELKQEILKDKPQGYQLSKEDNKRIWSKMNEISGFIVENDRWQDLGKEGAAPAMVQLILLRSFDLAKTDIAKQGAVDKFIDESLATQKEIKDLQKAAAEKLGVNTGDVMKEVKRIRENIGYVFNSETGRRSDSLPSKINVLTAIVKSEDRPPFNSGNEDKLRKWYEKAMKSEGQDQGVFR